MWTQSYTSSYMVHMTDKYQGFVSSPIGKLLVKNLGLPNPTKLDRYKAGDPLVNGTVLVGGRGRLIESLPGLLDVLGIAVALAHLHRVSAQFGGGDRHVSLLARSVRNGPGSRGATGARVSAQPSAFPRGLGPPHPTGAVHWQVFGLVGTFGLLTVASQTRVQC